MSALDPLRHLKHRLQREVGRVWLRIATRKPNKKNIDKMRGALKIQLTAEEIIQITKAVDQQWPANMLVFGTGHDSEYWHRLNRKGKTLFIEDDLSWVQRAKKVVPYLDIEHMKYDTRRKDWKALIENEKLLSLGLPHQATGHFWNVILVDGPRGYLDSDPGRMKSIFHASVLAAVGTDVFVHDCDREVERTYCDFYMKKFDYIGCVGRLRHYRKL